LPEASISVECMFGTSVTLTRLPPSPCYIHGKKVVHAQKEPTSAPHPCPKQRASIIQVESEKFIGILKRVSVTGGSAILSKGPIPEGTLAIMSLKTVFGKVEAQIQFLHTGADGIPLAQAFEFLHMDNVSRERFSAAADQMQREGFSDVEEQRQVLGLAHQSLSKLAESIRRLSAVITSGSKDPSEKINCSVGRPDFSQTACVRPGESAWLRSLQLSAPALAFVAFPLLWCHYRDR
jgi:hypothetical protein